MYQGNEKKDGTDQKTDFWRDPRPTNENPNFVHDYFQSSRLHFIGSFRARYESMMVSVGKKLGVNPAILLQNSIQRSVLASKRKPKERCIVHIDMDCFFASIAIRDNPSLKGKCIAVSHGGGEISSCSYEARKFGVRAGMFCKDARKICPQIISVPYDFPSYEKVSIQIYASFYSLPGVSVEAVSVDEVYLDITLAIGDDRDGSQSNAETLVQNLRDRIFSETGCTASAGIGPSKLVARLATKAAKPNGQLRVRQENVISYLGSLRVKDLPGIGWRTNKRLSELSIKSCSELRAKSLTFLQSEFGDKQGQNFYDYVRAIDPRPVEPLKPRKSIGAEASWGVRFYEKEGMKVERFLRDMADEVANRVNTAGAYGTKVTFKVYNRIRGADMSGYKHLGHGPCNIVTRSSKLPPRTTGDTLNEALRQAAVTMYTDLGIENEDFRGLGIQVQDLTFADLSFDHTALPVDGTRRIDSFFKPSHKKSRDICIPKTSAKTSNSPNNTLDAPTVPPDLNVGEIPSSDNDEIEPNVEQLEIDDNNILRAIQELPEFITQGPVIPAEESANSEREENDSNIPETEIPNGWDREVFKALPYDIRMELLQESRTKRRNQVENGARFRRQNSVQQHRKRSHNAILNRGDKNEMDKKVRKKQTAQITMTQFADISELRKKGNNVLHADEFKQKPLRECVELLHDLRPQGFGAVGKASITAEFFQKPKNRLEDEKEDGIVFDRERGELEIPSPPSLSSDSDSSYGVSGVVEKYGTNQSQIYETEDLLDFAPILQQWMRKIGWNIKSGHMELLRSRLVELVRSNRLQATDSELRALKAFAKDIEYEIWQLRFNEILEEIQDEIQRLYGFKLAINAFDIESNGET